MNPEKQCERHKDFCRGESENDPPDIDILVTSIISSSEVDDEQVSVLQAYLESVPVDELGVSRFLFQLVYNAHNHNPYLVNAIDSLVQLPSFDVGFLASDTVFSMLVNEAVSGSDIASLSTKVMIKILYSTDERGFVTDVFYSAIPKLARVRSFHIVLCALLASPVNVNTEGLRPYLVDALQASVAASDIHGCYRVLNAALGLCQSQCKLTDEEISGMVSIFIDSCDEPYILEILPYLIAFMDNPTAFGQWILAHLVTETGPVVDAMLKAWVMAFEKWEECQNIQFTAIVVDRMPDFPFQTSCTFFESVAAKPHIVSFFSDEVILRKAIESIESDDSLSSLRFLSACLTCPSSVSANHDLHNVVSELQSTLESLENEEAKVLVQAILQSLATDASST